MSDESDELQLNHFLKRHKNVLTEKEHKQTTYAAYPEIDGTSQKYKVVNSNLSRVQESKLIPAS